MAQIMSSFKKFRLKLKKVEKIARPFRYDLQSSPLQLYSGSDKEIKGLDLINRVPPKYSHKKEGAT